MQFELKDFLTAVGPSASLIFASWIFLSFLQQRYSASYDRYRALISEYRQHGSAADPHQRSVATQITLYKHRCELMRIATNIGLIAAILLVVTIIDGGVQVMFPTLGGVRYIGAATALLGLLLIIVAACYVVRENTLIQHAIDDEISDLPDLVSR